jgi:hypothetical protein
MDMKDIRLTAAQLDAVSSECESKGTPCANPQLYVYNLARRVEHRVVPRLFNWAYDAGYVRQYSNVLVPVGSPLEAWSLFSNEVALNTFSPKVLSNLIEKEYLLNEWIDARCMYGALTTANKAATFFMFVDLAQLLTFNEGHVSKYANLAPIDTLQDNARLVAALSQNDNFTLWQWMSYMLGLANNQEQLTYKRRDTAFVTFDS